MSSPGVMRDIQRSVPTSSKSRGFFIDDILFNKSKTSPPAAYPREDISPSPPRKSSPADIAHPVTSIATQMSATNTIPAAEYAAIAAMYAHVQAQRQHSMDLSAAAAAAAAAAQHQAMAVTSHPLFAPKPVHEHPLLMPAVHGESRFHTGATF